MKEVPVADKRNVVVLGHAHSGKSTLIDAVLYKLGLNDRQGSVDAGTSAADYNDEEKARKITVFAKPFGGNYTTATGRVMGLYLTDTPGYLDFYGQVIAAARAADAALIVVDASAGIQVGTQRAWKTCAQRELTARGFVITGLDKDNSNYAKVLQLLRSTFGAACTPMDIPLPKGTGVVDLLGHTPVPPAVADAVAEARATLIERAAESDEKLTEKFLNGETLTEEEIARSLADSVAEGIVIPVFAAVGTTGVGVPELLEGIARCFPSPDEHEHKTVDGKPIADGPAEPFVGQVWRTVNDPFVGHLSYVRVICGTLTPESEVLNSTRKVKEKVGAVLLVNGRKQEPVAHAIAGDLVALPKLKATQVGDTLCAVANPVQCPPMVFPRPVMMMATKGKTQADDDKIGTALQRVCEEDPTLQVDRNTETHEMVLMGLGDVHLDVAVGLMKSRSHVDVVLTPPRVPYRETVTSAGEGHYKHKKQSGGRGQYGEVYLKIQPRRPDDEEWFANKTVGGSIPHNFIPAVQKGVAEGMMAGALAGFPVADVKVTVYDGTFHDVDSSEIAFKIASLHAFREGMLSARPVLLEPIMAIKVTVPEQHLGEINGDLNHRRGRILGLELDEGMQVIAAEVPRVELSRYAAELRSMTGGQGTFEMEFSRYDQVPGNLAQKIVAEAVKDKKTEG